MVVLPPAWPGAPIATIAPLEDKLTENPNWSLAELPSISFPICTQAVPFHSYIRAWPLLSLFLIEPITTIEPSEDKLTELPDLSFDASPFISLPFWVQAVPFHLYKRTVPFWFNPELLEL